MRPLFILDDEPLPDPARAGRDGLLAVGGDLRPERLLDAYRRGIFPWYEQGLPILWFSPDPRMVLLTSELRINRSLRRRLKDNPFVFRLDTAFEEVIRSCARAPRSGQDGTWITPELIEAFVRLHEMGWAHSAESWLGPRLVGGLYGIAIGGIFFGESMFATVDDASKVAFVMLVRQLDLWGIEVVDCQVRTEHLERFGAKDWPRRRFLTKLAELVERPTRMGPWGQAPIAPP